MIIHHLNLCTMCPFGGRLLSGGHSLLRGELVVHALLVETPRDGLVLVDAGMGLLDAAHPLKRLGGGFFALARPRLREAETAARQVEALGFQRSDVRNIVVTHLDADHAGGILDFPDAKVHVHRAEHAAAMAPQTITEHHRYRRCQLDGPTRWELHDEGGDDWFGFRGLRAVADDVMLIPLPGHTRGHSCVAVRTGDRSGLGPEWLLHCGDAYFFHLEKEDPATCPPVLARFQSVIAADDDLRKKNAERLRELHREHGRRVRLFSAHDPTEFRTIEGVSRDRRAPR